MPLLANGKWLGVFAASVAVMLLSLLLHRKHHENEMRSLAVAKQALAEKRTQSMGETQIELEEKLRDVRGRATSFRLNLLDEDQFQEVLKEWGDAWCVRTIGEDVTSEYRKVQYSLSLEDAPMSIWSEVTGAVRRLQTRAGVRLKEIEVEADGDPDKRRFSRIRLQATVYLKLTEFKEGGGA